MVSISESGHATNVAKFETLIATVVSFGTTYNPSRESLSPAALQTLLDKAENSLSAVNVAHAAYSNAVAARKVAFLSLSRLITRINNSLKSSETNARIDESAQSIVRKLQGRRAVAKLTDEEKIPLEAAGQEERRISVSQMSFDNRLDNFDRLIVLLESVPFYHPNEEELGIIALKALYNELKEKNSEVTLAMIRLSNSRIVRNKLLYEENSGMVDIASACKTYIKSVFGTTSPQYRQVSRLYFKYRE